MKVLLNLFCGLLVALLVQACGKVQTPSPEEACHFQQNAYGQRVSWPQTPVTMYADITLDGDQVTALKDAMDIWNEATAKQRHNQILFKYGGRIKKKVGVQTDLLNVVSIADAWDGSITEQAQTMLLWDANNIIEADIQVNGEKEYSILDTGEPGKIDMVALFVHELGHVLGLVHIEPTEKQPYTVMNPYLARGDVERRNIGPVELNALKCEY